MRLMFAKNGALLRGALSDSQHCYCQCSSRKWGKPYSTWEKFKPTLASAATRSTSWIVSDNMRLPLLKESNQYHCRNNSSYGRDTRQVSRTDMVSQNQNQPELTGRQEKVLKKVKNKESSTTVFYDSLRIMVKGGTGGNGLPDKGGIGGKGGDVVVVGHKDVTLKKVSSIQGSKRFVASCGADSKFFCFNGMPGKSIAIPVPLGVSVVTELGHKIGEINKHGEKLVVAKGGAGASPSNSFFAEKGQSHHVTLDLKLIADVGFVGFPNAGKSTLLKALSRASPKIASYPFTTIRPNIGVVEFSDYRQISLADLPGLIEGAHANIGMGHKFLKHVERTKVLLFIVDIHGFQLSPQYSHRSALETIILLNKELELYREELTEKPAILALNKSDLPGSYGVIKEVRKILGSRSAYENFLETMPTEFLPENVLMFDKIIPISAKTDPISVNELKNTIRSVIDMYAESTGEYAVTTT